MLDIISLGKFLEFGTRKQRSVVRYDCFRQLMGGKIALSFSIVVVEVAEGTMTPLSIWNGHLQPRETDFLDKALHNPREYATTGVPAIPTGVKVSSGTYV